MVMNSFVPKTYRSVALWRQAFPLVLDAIIKAFESTMKLRADVLCRLNLFINYSWIAFRLTVTIFQRSPHSRSLTSTLHWVPEIGFFLYPFFSTPYHTAFPRQLRRRGRGCLRSVPGSPGRRENSAAPASHFCVLWFPLSSPSHILSPSNHRPPAQRSIARALSHTPRGWVQRAEMKLLGLEGAENHLQMQPGHYPLPTCSPPPRREVCVQ